MTRPKLKLRRRVPLWLFFMASVNACAGDGKNGSELGYPDVAVIIEDKCLRCHGDPRQNGAPISLTTYEEVYAERAAIESKVRGGDMPPTYLNLSPPVEDLTSSEREMLLEWLDNGAPE